MLLNIKNLNKVPDLQK